MRQPKTRLNVIWIQRTTKAGRYADGNGLYLQISSKGTKSWLFRYQYNKKSYNMGLGSVAFVSLAAAREKAIQCQKILLEGKNPLIERQVKLQEQFIEASKQITFDECVIQYIEAHSIKWRNKKHKSQWENTLSTYASPIFGKLSVQSIDIELIMRALEPIWYSKTETATRVRGRIECILDWATVRGYRSGINPARWRGHLDKLLPSRPSIQKTHHHEALPISELSEFISKLRAESCVTRYALEFLILTACRTNEVLGAKWSEINIEEQVWVIPAERMKAKREHRVPLSTRALEILVQLKEEAKSDFVFPGYVAGKPLSNMAMLQLIKKQLGYKITTHGFRSTFRDWAAEYTIFPREVAESALAHTLKNKAEAAYLRGDFFLKRRKLMSTWAEFCLTKKSPAEIVDISRKKAGL